MLRTRFLLPFMLLAASALVAPGSLHGQAPAAKPLYLDSAQPVEKRVEDLIARMTLEEKAGQLNMPCVYLGELGRDIPAKLAACRKFAEGAYVKGIGPGGGFFTLADNILREGPRQQAEYFNELQQIAARTRLKIPLLQTEEGTHGLMCSGGTVFPEGPSIGSTWNMALVERIYAAAAREARAVGIHQLFTLVVEPNRDPRLGRNEEGYSEDPYLCSRIAERIVRGAQGQDISAADKVVAGLCHYPGQSQPVSGFERGAMEISERMLREIFLPPWVAGIKKAGALGVMATYPAIDGTPAHDSDWILTKILRGELGFQGLVLGEGSGIETLVYERVAASQKEAGQRTLRAGLDVGISFEHGYMLGLIESVKEGRVPMALVDRALRRILTQKFRLGLFEKPYVDVERAVNGIDRAAHRDLALQVAREGIVLLKNEKSILPLRKNLKSIAVIGPNAHHERNLLGDYTARTILQKVVTILEGIKARVSAQTEVRYVKGCNVVGVAVNEFDAAREAARGADVAVVVVGENERRAPDGTNGEGKDVASLDLTGMQEELVKAVHSTGTPTVVVLINGRPLSVRWIAENVPALVEAWLPGEQGGHAVAEVLFGDYNPTGRLPITVPRHVGQLPVYYNYRPSKAYWMRRGYVDMKATPLYDFGYGLSYTTFEYSGLEVSPAEIRPSGTVRVSLNIKNTGSRDGAEVVQLYLRDVVSSVSRPVKELRGFEKVPLRAGESRRIEFVLGPEDLSLLDRNLRPVVEPGVFEVMIGASSEDIRLRGSFEVTPAAAPAQAAGWTRLFDGKTLAGWRIAARPEDRGKGFWKVEDAAITCDSRGRKDHDYVWLLSETEYGDFELRLKVRGFRDSAGNSGVQVRSRYDESAFWLDGPQVDIHPPAPWRTGLIYDETRGVRRWISPSLKDSRIEPASGPIHFNWKYSDEGDGWNDLHIVCRGPNISTVLNGIPVTDFKGAGILDDEAHRARNAGLKGHLALQLHVKDDLYIQFKDIRVRPLAGR